MVLAFDKILILKTILSPKLKTPALNSDSYRLAQAQFQPFAFVCCTLLVPRVGYWSAAPEPHKVAKIYFS